MGSDRGPTPLPAPVGQTAPLLFLHDHDTIAVIALWKGGSGLPTVTAAGGSARFGSVFVTVTTHAAILPAATVGGPAKVMVTSGCCCACRLIEPKASSPAQRIFRLRIIELRNMCAFPRRRIDDAYPDEMPIAARLGRVDRSNETVLMQRYPSTLRLMPQSD
jgi:hypothetical protein